jgi:hypothetical protein
MLPILAGRLQTRVFVLAVIGSLWTAAITPLLPPHDAPLHKRYQATFTVLAVVLVVGLAWECFYQLMQQFRWEKDWPTFFGFLTGINEGIAAWLIVTRVTLPGHPQISDTAFILHFSTVWFVTWMFVNGPMRVPFVRWRFRGGRLL